MSVESRMGVKRHELYTGLAAFLESALLRHGISPALAAIAANAAVDNVADYWRGQTVNFPMDSKWRLAVIELEIFDAYANGEGYDALARQHGLTDSAVRRVIARVRARLASFRHDQQLDLLDPSTGA